MKLLSIIFAISLALFVTFTVGKKSPNYEVTHYGCPEECHTQEDPACEVEITTSHFAALSTELSSALSYCGNYVVTMLADGSGKTNMVKAKIVDTCGSCEKYHVDLSSAAFDDIIEKRSKGVGKIIWGVYSSSGERKFGPIYSGISSTASSFGLSSDGFLTAFDKNAKALATSGSHTRKFSSSGVSNSGSSDKYTTKKTTTTKKIITTTRKTTKAIINTKTVNKPIYNPKSATTKYIIPPVKSVPAKTFVTKNIPNQVYTTKAIPGKTLPLKTIQNVNTLSPIMQTAVVPVPTSTVIVPQITNSDSQQKPTNADQKSDEKMPDEVDGPVTVGIIAVGGGCLGAAGLGLLLMKKKNPNKYEELKQKFPEAFSSVKRGLTRSATSLKRSVTSVQRKMTTKRGANNRKINVPSEKTTTQSSSIVNIGEDGIPRFSLIDA